MEVSKKTRSGSIFKRMLLFLLAFLVLQTSCYILAIFGSGAYQKTQESALAIFSERTANRKLYLENEMLRRWSNLDYSESRVLDTFHEVLAREGAAPTDLTTDGDLCEQLVAAVAPEILSMLRYTGATGAYMILNGPGQKGCSQSYPGLYVRDYDPSGYAADNSDLLLERGLPSLARSIGIPLDNYWNAFFDFSNPEDTTDEMFYAPILAALEAPAQRRSSEYFRRWSLPVSLNPADRQVIAYSIPLFWEDGTVLGVLGIDVSVEYLAGQLKYDELGEEQSGAYFLGVTEDGGNTYSLACSAGPNYKACFGGVDTIKTTPTAYGSIVNLPHEKLPGKTMYGAVQPLKLYNVNTPFEGEQWALIGIMEDQRLMAFPNRLRNVILFSALLSVALGLFMMVVMARNMSRPITKVAEDLRRSDPDHKISLRRLNLSEIDQLSDAIEELSNTAAAAAARVSTIVAMTNLPVGVFERRKGQGRVFCSRNLFRILDWPEQPEDDRYLSEEEFDSRMKSLMDPQRSDGGRVYCITDSSGGERWMQMFFKEDETCILGACLDVTRDMEDKRKMEYERDFDVLTALLNRRAFDRRVNAMFTQRQSEMEISALIMLDLDNLKYVNDTYGHDQGDRYIQAFSRALEEFYLYPSFVSRRSGDEFTVFLYGFHSKEAARDVVARVWAHVELTEISLPNGDTIKVRASGGLAWYPDDEETFTELLHLADFAMYNIKHTVKGVLREFDNEIYQEKSILLKGQDDLNRMIDLRLVKYALQPIVSAVDGSLYGYEMLMRPMVPRLTDLNGMFAVARAQSKLYQIERLTWFEAMGTFQRMVEEGHVSKTTRVFVNSLGNQVLSPEDLKKLEDRFAELLDRVVVEITEGDVLNTQCMQKKRECADSWGAMVALDDYGTGFNSESALISVAPGLVKVDNSIIRNISCDMDRTALLENLVGYAKGRGILVLAEGVETEEELEAVISCGVDLVQGYYVAHPNVEVLPVETEVAETIIGLHKKHHGSS